ncbi:MAG: hypothetical protein ABSB82_21850 [Terriglobia bacterium]|jgi:hypothetical protein
MRYILVFKYREPGRFPEECSQDEPIVLEEGEALAIPAVGDHVTCEFDGVPTDFEVVSRHFTYAGKKCSVDIEVGAAAHVHKALSLKE